MKTNNQVPQYHFTAFYLGKELQFPTALHFGYFIAGMMRMDDGIDGEVTVMRTRELKANVGNQKLHYCWSENHNSRSEAMDGILEFARSYRSLVKWTTIKVEYRFHSTGVMVSYSLLKGGKSL
jgi:hypothetical protein